MGGDGEPCTVETIFVSGDEATLDALVQGWMESIGPTTVAELADSVSSFGR